MFIGHYAPALAAAALPKAPKLGILFIAAQLVDIAFFIFVLGGVEAMRLTPGITVMNGLDLYNMPYTHSLLGALAFGGGTTVIVWFIARLGGGTTIIVWPRAIAEGNGTTVVAWPRGLIWTAALIVGAVVVSHWFLDLLVHRPDLTLTGSPPPLGLGLWNYPLIEMPLELGLIGASLGFYLSRTKHIAGTARHWPWTLGVVMLLVQLYNWLSPEPEVLDASLPISALFAFGLFAWFALKLGQTRTREGAGEN